MFTTRQKRQYLYLPGTSEGLEEAIKNYDTIVLHQHVHHLQTQRHIAWMQTMKIRIMQMATAVTTKGFKCKIIDPMNDSLNISIIESL